MDDEFIELEHTSREDHRFIQGSRKRVSFSRVTCFLFVLLAVVLAVVVGVIVFYAGVKVVPQKCLEKTICENYVCQANEGNGTATKNTTTQKPDDKKVVAIRLPLWLIPEEYSLTVRPDIYQPNTTDFRNSGNVTIKLRCDVGTDRFSIHAKDLKLTSWSLTHENAVEEFIKEGPIPDQDREFMNFTLTTALTPGLYYKLRLTYEGPLTNRLNGLYYSSYDSLPSGDSPVTKRYFAVTQFEPTDARRAFPCFDEPSLKATFTVSIQRKQEMTALSNMPIASSVLLADGWVQDNFNTSVKMSTYLLAMAICDFGYIEGKSDNTVVRIWGRKAALSQMQFALNTSVEVLKYYTEYFTQSFPLPKLDLIAIPDFSSGAMENWGLITYKETYLLYDPQNSASAAKIEVAQLISHELAHQWFGNLVTMAWWDDLWLNEGFAQYIQYVGANHTQPEWQMMSLFVTENVHLTKKIDALVTSHPIYVPVNHPTEINQIFDDVSYSKGASLIYMARFFLGDEVFQLSLVNYLNNRKYQNGFHDDLWAAMQQEADRRGLKDDRGNSLVIKNILETWILQMGYPMVSLEEGVIAGVKKLTLKQAYYLADSTQQGKQKYSSPFNYRWDIPISYTTNKSPRFDVKHTDIIWFYRNDYQVELPVDSDVEWVVINPKQYGLYRVNYPENYWNKLADQLIKNHEVIDPLNRAQLLDDAFNLALSGNLSISTAMSLTRYLAKEESYFPWYTAIKSLEYVSSALSRTDAYGDFKKYYKKLLTPLYNQTSADWVFNSKASIIDQLKQSLAIEKACEFDVGDCRERVNALFQLYRRNTTVNPVHPDVRYTVYCYGVKMGGMDAWNFAFQMYQMSNLGGEKKILLAALGCTNEEWLLQRSLNYILDTSKLKKQDGETVLVAVTKNNLGRYMAWEWTRANWDQLVKTFGESVFTLSTMAEAVTSKFYTQFYLDELKNFVASKNDLSTASQTLSQAIEKTEANVKYLEKNYKILFQWLSTSV